MIKHKLIMPLLLLISTQAIASLPCPTCSSKGYMFSLMEETLISQQGEKGSTPQKIPESSPLHGKIKENAERNSLFEGNIVNQMYRKGSQDKSVSNGLPSYAPKKDEILKATNAPSQYTAPQAGIIYFSQDRGNANLRGTFDTTMALNSKLQLQQQIRNSRR